MWRGEGVKKKGESEKGDKKMEKLKQGRERK